MNYHSSQINQRSILVSGAPIPVWFNRIPATTPMDITWKHLMSQNKIYRPDYSTAKDARVIQTREALRVAFLELLDRKPLEQITIREIAATAGIGYTTFFRHHPGKDELLNDIAAAEIRKLIDLSLSALDSSNTSAAALALCTYVDEHRSLWSKLLTGGAASKLREEFIRISREIAKAREPSNGWLPASAGAIIAASGIIELLTWWLNEEKPIPVEQLAAILERIVISPVVNA